MKQRTVVRYIVNKYDDHAYREAQSPPPVDTLDSNMSDIPRGPSPAREDGTGASQSGLLDEGSTDEAKTWHSAPMPGYEGAAACMSRINTYLNVRLADIERTDLTKQQGNGGGTGTTDTMPTWPK